MIEDLKRTLWATADKLRANMDAAEYKHLVLGLILWIRANFSHKEISSARDSAKCVDRDVRREPGRGSEQGNTFDAEARRY